MNVELIQYTPEPEKVVAAAARLCYSSDPVPELMEQLTDEKIAGLYEDCVQWDIFLPLNMSAFNSQLTVSHGPFLISLFDIGLPAIHSVRSVM